MMKSHVLRINQVMTNSLQIDLKKFVIAITLLFLLLFVGVTLQNHAWNPKTFVLEGTRFSANDPDGTTGYDGQFAYYIARDPLTAHEIADTPGKRYLRIVYPMLAWLLSAGGNPVVLPWVLIGINVFAVTVIAGVTADLLSKRGANPIFSFTLVGFVGTLFALRADLNEPLAIALALWGWQKYERKHLVLSVFLFGLAGLTKEIGLAFPLALVLWELRQKRWKLTLVFLLSFAPFVFWQIVMRWLFDYTGESIAPEWIPFLELRSLQDPISFAVVFLWVVGPMFLTGIWAFWDSWHNTSSDFPYDSLLVLVHFLVIAILPQTTWEDPLAVLRTSIGLVAAILLWMASHHPRLLPYAVALWAPSGLILFLVPGMVW
jgi:hypothetical protein